MSPRGPFRIRRFLWLGLGLVAALITVRDDPIFDFASMVLRPAIDGIVESPGVDSGPGARTASRRMRAAALCDDCILGDAESCTCTVEDDADDLGDFLVPTLVAEYSAPCCAARWESRSDATGDDVDAAPDCECGKVEEEAPEPAVVTAASPPASFAMRLAQGFDERSVAPGARAAGPR